MFSSSATSSLAAAGLLVPILAGCDPSTSTLPVLPPPPSHASVLEPPPFPDPADFVSEVTNPFFPLAVGTVFTYRADTDEGEEVGRVEVTALAKTILGVDATVVHDEVFLGGELAEDTYDWYAQDRWGNVWYLGEDSCEVEDGECVPEGGWEAGVDGAVAGIIMWADPAAHRGKPYRQEFYEGVAEDMGKVLRLGVPVEVEAGSFDGCLETMDWTPLEPGAREHKFYCPGTGLVLEVHPRRGRGRNELVDVS